MPRGKESVYPRARGTSDLDGDGLDEIFVKIDAGAAVESLSVFQLTDGALSIIEGPDGRPWSLTIGGVALFGDGMECDAFDADGIPM